MVITVVPKRMKESNDPILSSIFRDPSRIIALPLAAPRSDESPGISADLR